MADKSSVAFKKTRQLPLFSWGSGPIVLLVHGWSGRGSQLGAFAEPLVERGYRVVAFDAPSHGESEGKQTGPPEMARAIERIATHLGSIKAIVAHSLGTAATSIAIAHGLPVERLVYLAPPDNPGDYLYRAARYLGFGDYVASLAQVRIEKRFDFHLVDINANHLAPNMDVPLLVVHDEDDPEVPHEEGENLARLWPGARIMTTTGLGHRRIIRDPEVVDEIVDFLSVKSASTKPFGTMGFPEAREESTPRSAGDPSMSPSSTSIRCLANTP